MSKIVLVSNRVASLVEGKPSAGGLAIAVLEGLQGESCLWMGWNGKIDRAHTEPALEHGRIGSLDTLTWPLSQRDYDGFYRGFSNSVIWPAFHYRLDHIRFKREDYQSYLRVNQLFAKRLSEHISKDDVIWVHDYHFMHLAQFCRALGLNNKIGFFLHIPFPPPGTFSAIPVHRELSQALSAYDLLGFQTQTDVQAFNDYRNTYASPGQDNSPFELETGNGPQPQIAAYPISIDFSSTIKDMELAQKKRTMSRIQKEFGENQLIISVDRLDYTKGIVERLNGYEEFLRLNPKSRGAVRLVQISPPSRTDVHGYSQIRHEIEQLTSQINGKWAEPSWMPINYINRSFDRPTLLAFFRRCDIGLVSSLRDGMNLVAKEYVTVQCPEDPGVLILSEFTGAAQELHVGALLINPYDKRAVADAIAQALSMRLEERQERHAAMMQVLQKNNLQTWKQSFMNDLLGQP